jgi:hypothetical protein
MDRVTYCERFLPPISIDAAVVPQITPVMAVPVLDPTSDVIYRRMLKPGPPASQGSVQRRRV